MLELPRHNAVSNFKYDSALDDRQGYSVPKSLSQLWRDPSITPSNMQRLQTACSIIFPFMDYTGTMR